MTLYLDKGTAAQAKEGELATVPLKFLHRPYPSNYLTGLSNITYKRFR